MEIEVTSSGAAILDLTDALAPAPQASRIFAATNAVSTSTNLSKRSRDRVRRTVQESDDVFSGALDEGHLLDDKMGDGGWC